MYPRTDGNPTDAANGQPNSDAPNPGDVGGNTAGTSSADVSTASEGPGSDWLREAFMGRVGLRATPDEDSANGGSKEPEPKTDDVAKPAGEATDTSAQPAPFRVFNSEEEFRRVVQSEKDREIAREKQRQKQAEDRRLLEEHPHEYARIKREELEEADRLKQLQSDPIITQRISDFASEQIALYDEGLLNPLVRRVADSPEKAALLGNIKPGVEGRGELGGAMLGLFEKQVRSEARRVLSEDPTFIKEILVRHGGQRAEPDVVSAVGAAPRREDESMDNAMNDVLTMGRRSRR